MDLRICHRWEETDRGDQCRVEKGQALVQRIVRETISGLFERFGYRLIPNWRLERLPAAEFLGKFFRYLEIDCVLDVGANLGQYHDFLRTEVGYSGKIVSFEPIATHVAALKRRARTETDWIVQGIALGSARDSTQFNVMASTAFSSFLEPDHSVVSNFKGHNEVSERIIVRVETLDEVLPTLEKQLLVRNFYLKLDTQGCDLEVAKGSSNSISSIRAVQTEASVVPIYQGMPDYVETIRTFQSLGFELSGIFPNNSGYFPRLVEFDCFMINRKYLPR
jgi:FkbM family methyltransferase